jgi:uncharacterized peroxidase-related enzyme
MSFIETVSVEEASPAQRDFYRRQQGALDYLPNYAQVFVQRPEVMAAWARLQAVLRQAMGYRRYSLVSLAAALAIRSSYCSLAHARNLMRHDFTLGEMIAVLRKEPDSPLSQGERCLMTLAGKVARDAASLVEAHFAPLREQGFSDREIFDVVTAAAARCFFAKVPDALGVPPDDALADMEPELLRLLCVGRQPRTLSKIHQQSAENPEDGTWLMYS